MNRDKLIKIQMETIAKINERNDLMTETKFSKFTYFNIISQHNPNNKKASIYVVNMDTIQATIHFQLLYNKTFCMLVMANRYNCGGGYLTGAQAQEESICRRTNLPRAFQILEYPLPEFGGAYCKGLFIIRDTPENEFKFLIQEHRCDAILVAAYNRPPIDGDMILGKYVEGTKRKIISMFEEILRQGVQNVVLGALGCGAFRNPPRHMAQLFKEVIIDYHYDKKFENIVFAIMDNHYTNNFKIFSDEFSKI